ncbi:transcriptional regulator [Candidatus Shapirobacteria bacterium CG09_land_8_20_14_0_10_47_13]|uniref:Transcriptional regulator n=1 Tax=Candidatus Shapirobacteria bacterium CG09_land_8_20_14_0_10_47_13 TaxID=1974481 RepID=A0A2H0WMN9_9BACT|nr:MAG: transcriptional regulator [Candidatus Shapirobacteria bacterium CG09_land_8_20_14_0_10_47_13]
MKYYTFDEHKKELMKDPGFVRAYQKLQPEFAIIRKIIEARIKDGITQKKLAKRMGTKQSAISRLESGNANPSLSFLGRLAEALNSRLEIRFLPK